MVSKFVAKLRKYRILDKDIHTFLGLDYRDSYYNIVPFCNRNQYFKNQMNRIII